MGSNMKTFTTVEELTNSDEYKAKKAFTCHMPFSEYRKAPGYSQSGIKDFLKCPALYKIRQTEPFEATKAMTLGSFFDARITGDDFDKYFVSDLDGRTKEGKASIEMAEAKGLTRITKADADDVQRWLDSLLMNNDAQVYTLGQYQVCGFAWIDGVAVKGRADILGSNFIADLKLVADGSPDQFSRSIVDGYDIQAGLYQMIFGAAFAKDLPFIFICQEKHSFKPTPAFTGVYEIDHLGLQDAKKVIKATLAEMVDCEFSGEYLGYGVKMISAKWPRKL